MSSIQESDLLFWAGGNCLQKFGTPVWRRTPPLHGGEGLVEVHTRASTGTYIDRDGEVKLAETNLPRVEMVDLDGDGVRETPTLLLEDARTNLILRSEDLATTWVNVRTTDSTDADTAPDGATTADRLIEDATASATHYIQQQIAITADVDVAYSVYAKAGTRSVVALQLSDVAGADTVTTWFNLSTGAVGTTGTVAGTGAHVRSYIESMGNSWYRCTVVGSIGGAVTTCECRTMLADADASVSYNGDGASYAILWGGQGEDDVGFSSSHIPTVGSTVARSADTFNVPFYSSPRALTVYSRHVEGGTILTSSLRIFQIGSAADVAPRFIVSESGGGGFYRLFYDTADGNILSTLAAAPSVGDTVELLATLTDDGKVQLSQSINGATATVTALSAALALPAAWSGPQMHIGMSGAGNRGFGDIIDVLGVEGIRTFAECRNVTA